jgi:chemotaxis-related protein WspB
LILLKIHFLQDSSTIPKDGINVAKLCENFKNVWRSGFYHLTSLIESAMLMLLFYVGDDRYALDSKRVVEVVPTVTLKKMHGAPQYIPGLFNYRGHLVPVIDLCLMIQGTPARAYLSTRIVLVNCQLPDTSENNSPNLRGPIILGLMAERVTETLDKPETEFVSPAIKVNSTPYLGETIADDRGMIQFVRVEHLLPECQKTYLRPQQEY